jgi:hypothetical protein
MSESQERREKRREDDRFGEMVDLAMRGDFRALAKSYPRESVKYWANLRALGLDCATARSQEERDALGAMASHKRKRVVLYDPDTDVPERDSDTRATLKRICLAEEPCDPKTTAVNVGDLALYQSVSDTDTCEMCGRQDARVTCAFDVALEERARPSDETAVLMHQVCCRCTRRLTDCDSQFTSRQFWERCLAEDRRQYAVYRAHNLIADFELGEKW